MTASEFCAWLDGFSAGIHGAPSAEQWQEIQRRRAMVGASLAYGVITSAMDLRGQVFPVPGSSADGEWMKDRSRIMA